MDFPIFRRAVKIFGDRIYNFRNEAEFIRFLKLYIDLWFIEVILVGILKEDSFIKDLLSLDSFKENIIDSSKLNFIENFNSIENIIRALSAEKAIYF